MANTLTDIAPDIYLAADMVGRELVGAIPSVMVNTEAVGAAVGQRVNSFFTRAATATDTKPSMTIPEGTDQEIDNKFMTISKSRSVNIPWTGEEYKYVSGGVGFQSVMGDQIAQAMRTLANEAERDLCAEIYKNASRAVGTAGTAPFASDHDLVADVRKVLVDNGTPINGEVSIVLNTLAGSNLRKLASLQSVNQAGSDATLRRGTLLDLQGLMIKESAGIQLHTAGTGTGYLLNDAAHAIGDTAITVDTGTGTILQGDIVTFGGDSDNQYVVNTALSGDTFYIGAPGSRVALANDADVTVAGNYTPNIAFHRNAAEIAFRAPAVPMDGDAATDRMLMQDPYSGLVFDIAIYKGHRKVMLSVGAAWGVKAWKPEFIALVAG